MSILGDGMDNHKTGSRKVSGGSGEKEGYDLNKWLKVLYL
jgi:hypothetical protein